MRTMLARRRGANEMGQPSRWRARRSTTMWTVCLVGLLSAVGASAPASAAMTYGSFEVTVAVDPPEADAGRAYLFSYECRRNYPNTDPELITGYSWAVVGESVTVSRVPVGSRCWVLHESRDQPAPGWEWFGEPVTKPSFVDIRTESSPSEGRPEKVALLNRARPTVGSFEVTQVVEPAAADPGLPFRLQYLCLVPDQGWLWRTISVSTADPVRVDDVPVGSYCTFEQIQRPEPAYPHLWTHRRVEPSAIVIGHGTTTAVTFTNGAVEDVWGYDW